MKVTIEEIGVEEQENVIIRCHEMSDNILRIVQAINAKSVSLIGYEGEEIHRLSMRDVYYFEAVDNKVFIYCKEHVYESKQKLYEIEEMCQGRKFMRASKSTIINLSKIAFIKPSLSGRFEAKMDNDETIVVSRKYVPIMKDILGL